jgi:hypothetical protein
MSESKGGDKNPILEFENLDISSVIFILKYLSGYQIRIDGGN